MMVNLAMNRRVVVTGTGMISCFGIGRESLWDALCNEKTGIGPISRFDTSDYRVHIGAEVPSLDLSDRVDPKLAKRADRFIQYGLHCAHAAVEDAGYEFTDANRCRTGVLVGSGIGGMETWEEQYTLLLNKGPRRVSPFLVPMMITDMASGLISIEFGAQGPNLSVSTACATGTHAIGLAAGMIAAGQADAMITGGVEAGVTKTALSGFCSSQALSVRNDEPEKACRPMDCDRDGFVLGEGGCIILLEEYEMAKARGAEILGEIVGFGMSGDAYHITAPCPDGAGAILAINAALAMANLNADDIDYVNLHAPGTPGGDAMEAAAVMSIYGSDTPALSSTKANHGHQLGATGATELVLSLIMAENGYIPPTLNCEELDEGVDIDMVRGSGREMPMKTVMSNSFGFGGHNAVLIASRANL